MLTSLNRSVTSPVTIVVIIVTIERAVVLDGIVITVVFIAVVSFAIGASSLLNNVAQRACQHVHEVSVAEPTARELQRQRLLAQRTDDVTQTAGVIGVTHQAES